MIPPKYRETGPIAQGRVQPHTGFPTMVDVKGHRRLVSRFKKMASPAMEKRLGKALFAAGEIVEDRAKGSIMAGSASGHSGGKHQHVASKPGEAPNNDLGGLHGNIETVQTGVLEVEISSNAEYSAALEFGTSKMEARPFMGPAARETKGEVVALINEAIRHELRKAAR
ncbi:HK97-gp10 family putative phage morphogenesis protein [Sphingobium sp. AS12]|uniref:HK97-gp10 family putative phage morphogenesis protein n=1 Tax=Sphingobium sp. AS12 TaxID=2849495 RepID=UPI0034A4A04D